MAVHWGQARRVLSHRLELHLEGLQAALEQLWKELEHEYRRVGATQPGHPRTTPEPCPQPLPYSCRAASV